jgi:hypothetical protein
MSKVKLEIDKTYAIRREGSTEVKRGRYVGFRNKNINMRLYFFRTGSDRDPLLYIASAHDLDCGNIVDLEDFFNQIPNR